MKKFLAMVALRLWVYIEFVGAALLQKVPACDGSYRRGTHMVSVYFRRIQVHMLRKISLSPGMELSVLHLQENSHSCRMDMAGVIRCCHDEERGHRFQ